MSRAVGRRSPRHPCCALVSHSAALRLRCKSGAGRCASRDAWSLDRGGDLAVARIASMSSKRRGQGRTAQVRSTRGRDGVRPAQSLRAASPADRGGRHGGTSARVFRYPPRSCRDCLWSRRRCCAPNGSRRHCGPPGGPLAFLAGIGRVSARGIVDFARDITPHGCRRWPRPPAICGYRCGCARSPPRAGRARLPCPAPRAPLCRRPNREFHSPRD